MKEKHLLDRELEHELNRNIDLILTNTSKKNEDVIDPIELPDISFEDAVREISGTASNMISVSNMLLNQSIGDAAYGNTGKQEVEPAIKSSSILLLCSQIRYLQKLSLVMRMRQDG